MTKLMFSVASLGLLSSAAHADFKADSPGAKPAEQMTAYRLAECIVARDAIGAERVLGTLPGTKENAKANREIVPTVTACWNAMYGGNMRVGGSLMRGSIAEVLYRRGIANSGGQATNPYAASAKD